MLRSSGDRPDLSCDSEPSVSEACVAEGWTARFPVATAAGAEWDALNDEWGAVERVIGVLSCQRGGTVGLSNVALAPAPALGCIDRGLSN